MVRTTEMPRTERSRARVASLQRFDYGVPPLGFQAGDVNLYRFVDNGPTNAIDPSGLQKGPVKATFRNQYGVPTGFVFWSFTAPESPKDLNIYTYVDMNWEVKSCNDDCDNPRKGNYQFWFQGLLKSREFSWNLSPHHGSHKGIDNKNKAWPIFDGKTDEEKEKQLEQYLAKSLDLTNTSGTLNVRIMYRGYKEAATEKFKPVLPSEQGGPFETPGKTTGRDGKPELRHPNRMRSPLRTVMPWLAEKPTIWNNKPEWEHVVEFTYTWDWCSKEFGNYTIKYPGKDHQMGTTPYTAK